MKAKKVLLTLFVLFPCLVILAQDAREIAAKTADAIEFESMEMSSTLKIYDHKGNMRQRQLSVATSTFGGITKTLMKFISPPDVKGTAMLIYDYETKEDDMWLYLPSTRKTRRIISREKGRSLMGSVFSNADMSKPNLDFFTYKITGEENYQGKNCWKLETTCKNEKIADENTYRKKIAWVEKSSFLTQKIEFYDLEGKKFKILIYSDFRKQASGKYFSYTMIAENLQNKRKSELLVDQFTLGTKLTENYFSPTSLEK